MTFEILFVLLALLGMVIALVLDKMRPFWQRKKYPASFIVRAG